MSQFWAGTAVNDAWETVLRPHPLDEGEVHVWRVPLEGDLNEISLGRALLSGDERKRADRFLQAAHGHRFTLCRATLRRLLAYYAHSSPEAIVFRYGKHGKPAIDVGAGKAEVEFNVAHSGNLAVMAFGRQGRLGIDLEQIDPSRDVMKIAHRFFSPGEVATLDQLPPIDRVNAFYTCWARKEAFIKAQGMGLALALDSFDVSVQPGDAPRLLRLEGAPEAPDQWMIADLPASSRCTAALATDVPVEIRQFHPRDDRYASILNQN